MAFKESSMSVLRLIFLGVFILYSTIAGAAVDEQVNEQKNTQSLINDIRQGGYVLYMRHAASNRNQTDIDTENLDDCSQQRNLSAEGREQAKTIGEAFKRLKIPVGTITTSPYCRCVDTAQLAFGRGVKSDDLRFTISEDEQETQRLSKSLQQQLSIVPNDAGNSVIVAHTGNLKEAAKIWPKPEGVIHVFKPLGKNGFKHIGRIEPGEWKTLK
jgi:phosphohistidine phosphatase SixA